MYPIGALFELTQDVHGFVKKRMFKERLLCDDPLTV